MDAWDIKMRGSITLRIRFMSSVWCLHVSITAFGHAGSCTRISSVTADDVVQSLTCIDVHVLQMDVSMLHLC